MGVIAEQFLLILTKHLESCVEKCFREFWATVGLPTKLGDFLRHQRQGQELTLQKMSDRTKGVLPKQSLHLFERSKQRIPEDKFPVIEEAYCQGDKGKREELRRLLRAPLEPNLEKALEELKRAIRTSLRGE